MPTIAHYRAAIAGLTTEAAARNAVQRALASAGYHHLPHVETARTPESGTVRVYVWGDVPGLDDDLVMLAGPKIETTLYTNREIKRAEQQPGHYWVAMTDTGLSESATRRMARTVERSGGTAKPKRAFYTPVLPAETTSVLHAIEFVDGFIYAPEIDVLSGAPKYWNEGMRLDALNDLVWQVRIAVSEGSAVTSAAAFAAMLKENPDLAPWMQLQQPNVLKRISTAIGAERKLAASAAYRKQLEAAGVKQKQRKRHQGAQVNKEIAPPDPPGSYVDGARCRVCGQRFMDFKGGVRSFSEAHEMHRERAGEGYRSRGTALWSLHVMKLERWYERHMDCAMGWDEQKHKYALPIFDWVDDGVHARANDPSRGVVGKKPPVADEVRAGGVNQVVYDADGVEIPF